MRSLNSYPGVLTVLLVAAVLAINGVVDFIDYELAGPSFLGSAGMLLGALILVAVYEFRKLRNSRRVARTAASETLN